MHLITSHEKFNSTAKNPSIVKAGTKWERTHKSSTTIIIALPATTSVDIIAKYSSITLQSLQLYQDEEVKSTK